jgi:small-conductance mechanosensitive channel
LALRAFVDQRLIDWNHGDKALFDITDRKLTAAIRIPGVRFEIVGLPSAGWATVAPDRWLIRGLTLALALVVAVAAFLIFGGKRSRGSVSQSLAIMAAVVVLLLGAGVAALVDKTQHAARTESARDAAQAELVLLASRATRDITQQFSTITNLAAFVTARPNLTDAEFREFAQRLRQESPELLSIRLARDGKVSHAEPPDSIDPSLFGTDLTRGPAEAALNAMSIDTGTPVLTRPQRLPDGSEAFLYRRPIYLGDGSPSRDRFWGFGTVLIDRKVVLCKLGLCVEPQRFTTSVRITVNNEPHPAFAGDDAMFAPGSDSVQTSIRVPGARIDLAARPVDGWAATSSNRWILWSIALPAAFAAAGGLLVMFVKMRGPQLKIWIGVLLGLAGALLAMFNTELTQAVSEIGFGLERFVWPAKLTLIALTSAFTINAVLAAYVWEASGAPSDQMMRAPAILRSFVAVAIYGLALLWAAAFAFGLSLQGVGLTSGVVGIVIGIAVQRIILDFFSGVMIGIERPFQIGDWIEINNGTVRGMVTEMTWRTTTLRTAVPDYITVPNSVLAQAIINNRSRPNRWTDASLSVLIDMSVPFERVEAVMLKVFQIAQPMVPNLLAEPAPSVVITEFKDSQAVYKFTFYVEFGTRSEVKARSTMFKLLQRAFLIAGIEVGWARSETRTVDAQHPHGGSGQPATAQ